MSNRIAYDKVAPDPYKVMLGLEKYLHSCSIEPLLGHMVKMRASQINGCAFCLDMHSKDLMALGETPQRIFGLDAWRECPYYTDRERAALEWTDALTLVHKTHAEDEIYERVKPHFTDQEMVDLTWFIGTINLWNRVAIAMRPEVGNYKSPIKKAEG